MTAHPAPDTTAAAVRETAGGRQQTLARAVGVPLPELARWEAGGEIPATPAAEAYARIVGELAEQQEARRG